MGKKRGKWVQMEWKSVVGEGGGEKWGRKRGKWNLLEGGKMKINRVCLFLLEIKYFASSKGLDAWPEGGDPQP